MFVTQVAGRCVLRLLERQSLAIPLRQSILPLPGLQSIASNSLRYQPFQTRHLSLSSSPRPSRILEQVNRRQPYFTKNAALRLRTSGFNGTLQKRSFTLPRIVPEGRTAFGVFARFIASVVIGLFVILAAILLHDSFTYSERHVGGVPTSPLALHPRTGGPKNLPIVDTGLSQEEDDTTRKLAGKPKLVIVGGGWGAVAILKHIRPEKYNVTVISPDNFNLFTPLLPSACVGTVEVRTLVEPLRKIIARVKGHYMSGKAMDVEMGERLIEVEVGKDEHGNTQRCYVPYDKLVIVVGSSTSTHGVPGLEHCFQLKSIPDAQAIRRRIMTNLEIASLPTTTPEERKRLLSMVIAGGGPTGVEVAAEIADMMSEDVLKYFPKLLRSEMSIRIIQSREHILNTYSQSISEFTEKRFARSDIEIIKNARVSAVYPDRIAITVKTNPKDPNSKLEKREYPAGFVLWSTGIAMNPFVKTLVEKLPNQHHSKAIVVDNHLRVKGSPLGTVYCVGDAATIDTNMVDYLTDLFDKADTNKDQRIDYAEWEKLAKTIKTNFPLAGKQFEKVHDLFIKYDTDKDNHLSLNDVARAFYEISKKITTLPATAQVASQQGEYLGKKFTQLSKQHDTLIKNQMMDLDDAAYSKPFKYMHLGSLAYVGNSAVFDLGGYSFTGGLVAMYAWRSVYWSEQSSVRTKTLLMIDWIKRGIFGRDLSKVSISN
ncbi:hypothetical protein QFC20_000822 [Naganishia adeliensis]|uniref:Uncharacterized protein n=1 Tax=Naganishia adeliensis TaxID=92952 RepID=A0ACC2WX94_9TREE|nr:hypothetical protein QFC20_000822 [Naganishia adeliensis]